MKERIHHVWAPNADKDDQLHWPAEREERDKLASQLLGACIVSAIDGWLDIAFDKLYEEQSALWRRNNGGPKQWEQDQRFRALFQSMTAEQRDAVRKLLVSTVRGAFFSALAGLDQFPAATSEHEGAALELIVHDADTDQTLASVVDGDVFDLHDRLGNWLKEFSDHAVLFQG